MKKSYVLLLAFCGLMAVLLAPGTGVANNPTGWVPPLDNIITVPNTGGGHPDWGSGVHFECHADGSPYMKYYTDTVGTWTSWTDGPVYGGMVVLWAGSSLPTLSSYPTLDALLNSPDGSKVNDLLIFESGIYWLKVHVISEPQQSLLPFEFEDPNDGTVNHQLWLNYSDLYTYNTKIISADLSQVYTPYQPQKVTDPGWDPSVPDWQYYTTPGYLDPGYPPPSTWTQYIFDVANDPPIQTPEPGALLLLGSGLMALAGMRRVVKA